MIVSTKSYMLWLFYMYSVSFRFVASADIKVVSPHGYILGKQKKPNEMSVLRYIYNKLTSSRSLFIEALIAALCEGIG